MYCSRLTPQLDSSMGLRDTRRTDCSAAVPDCIQPIMSKAAGSWAAVQRRHSLLQCGSTINIHLQLLQFIWCLLYLVRLRSGACIARVQVLLGRHSWPYHKCTILIKILYKLPQGHLWPEPLDTTQHATQRLGAFAFASVLVAADNVVLEPHITAALPAG